jgi:hypothetical protein
VKNKERINIFVCNYWRDPGMDGMIVAREAVVMCLRGESNDGLS